MVNKAILAGYIGKEVKYEKRENYSKALTTLATSSYLKTFDGKENITTWHNLCFYNKKADFAKKHLKKGSMVYIEGRIDFKSWKDENGKWNNIYKIIVNEVRFLTTPVNKNNSKKIELIDSVYDDYQKYDNMNPDFTL